MIVALRQCGSLGHRRGEVDDRAQSLGSTERIALLLKLGDWTSLVRASDPCGGGRPLRQNVVPGLVVNRRDPTSCKAVDARHPHKK